MFEKYLAVQTVTTKTKPACAGLRKDGYWGSLSRQVFVSLAGVLVARAGLNWTFQTGSKLHSATALSSAKGRRQTDVLYPWSQPGECWLYAATKMLALLSEGLELRVANCSAAAAPLPSAS